MTASANGSTSSVSRRRGPRYRLSGEVSGDLSESLLTFRSLTDGLSNRLPMPSVEGMRAGTVNNPISLMRRFLTAMRSAGLPKERALRTITWMQGTVDSLWPMEQTPLTVLEEKAMRAEACDDLAEKRYDLEHSAITLRERIVSLTNEIVCDQLTLAKLEREMESQ